MKRKQSPYLSTDDDYPSSTLSRDCLWLVVVVFLLVALLLF